MSAKVLFGFHALTVRLKMAPETVQELVFDPERRDARMRQFLDRAREAGVRMSEGDAERLRKMAGTVWTFIRLGKTLSVGRRGGGHYDVWPTKDG